jgi:hypothetical protein
MKLRAAAEWRSTRSKRSHLPARARRHAAKHGSALTMYDPPRLHQGPSLCPPAFDVEARDFTLPGRPGTAAIATGFTSVRTPHQAYLLSTSKLAATEGAIRSSTRAPTAYPQPATAPSSPRMPAGNSPCTLEGALIRRQLTQAGLSCNAH